MWSFLASEDDVFLFFLLLLSIFIFLFPFFFPSLLPLLHPIAGTWEIATHETGYIMNKQNVEIKT